MFCPIHAALFLPVFQGSVTTLQRLDCFYSQDLYSMFAGYVTQRQALEYKGKWKKGENILKCCIIHKSTD